MFKVINQRERWLIKGSLALIILASLFLVINSYLSRTEVEPQIGGHYTEAILGQPRYINPVLAQTNDADRDLSQIIFSGLFKYDSQGNLIPDLAQEYQLSDNGLVYEVKLRDNLLWHDQQPLTADDIVFTIQTIQNPEYNSPLRNNWQGVEVEKIDQQTVRFKLKNPYAPFIHNLTLGILPRHRWAGISAQNFPLAEYNLKPIGSGPYQFKSLDKDESGQIKSIELARNNDYYLPGPYIKTITFKFYQDPLKMLEAYQRRQVDGFSSLLPLEDKQLKNHLKVYQINLPIYFAIFFNQTESKALSDKVVRLALAYATNKEEIIEEVFHQRAQIIDSPIPQNWPGHTSEIDLYDFALEHAQNILEAAGWQDKDNDGIRENEVNGQEVKLAIKLTSTDWPELEQVARLIKKQWEKIGAEIELEIVSADSIQNEYIRPRHYQALLFGEVLGAEPDPFAFWHSSQRKDPGLNLSLYQNKEIDKILEQARQTLDPEKRNEQYKEFQQKLVKDVPAVFLYSPFYLYLVNKKIKGIKVEKLALPSQRFSQIEQWYIKTRRIEKNPANQED